MALNLSQGAMSFNLRESVLYGIESQFIEHNEPNGLFTMSDSELFIYQSQAQADKLWFNIDHESEANFINSHWLNQGIHDQSSSEMLLSSLGVNHGTLRIENSLFQDQRPQGLALYLGPNSHLDLSQSEISFNHGYGIYGDQAENLLFNELYIQQNPVDDLLTEAESDPRNSASVALYLHQPLGEEEEAISIINPESLDLVTNAAIVLQNENILLPEEAISCRGSLWIGDCPVFSLEGIGFCLGHDASTDSL